MPKLPAAVASLATAACIALIAAPSVRAQDLADQGLIVWKDSGGCTGCHGVFGEGGDGIMLPAGPSLRRSRLETDALKETIACGRPGTKMPLNLDGAYTKTPCYGMPVGAAPDTVSPGASLSEAQLNALVEFIAMRIKGKGSITKRECAAYYGDPNDPKCDDYR